MTASRPSQLLMTAFFAMAAGLVIAAFSPIVAIAAQVIA
jgi:hypothetical protein